MLKKQIYPKTKRITNNKVEITEKIDGSNLTIFKLNDEVYFATRNNIYTTEEILNKEVKVLKGLSSFVSERINFLKYNLNEKSAICYEWIGEGRIKYDGVFDSRLLMFAKANIDDNLELFNIKYNHELFIYPFINKEIPNFISTVPIINTEELSERSVDIEYLNKLYEKYKKSQNRDIEGFIINIDGDIKKYVRHKNGKQTEHKF